MRSLDASCVRDLEESIFQRRALHTQVDHSVLVRLDVRQDGRDGGADVGRIINAVVFLAGLLLDGRKLSIGGLQAAGLGEHRDFGEPFTGGGNLQRRADRKSTRTPVTKRS